MNEQALLAYLNDFYSDTPMTVKAVRLNDTSQGFYYYVETPIHSSLPIYMPIAQLADPDKKHLNLNKKTLLANWCE